MTDDTRQRFQGKCLQSQEGSLFMHNFDDFPPVVRERARNSKYNLCAACIVDIAGRLRFERKKDTRTSLVEDHLTAISTMEAEIEREIDNG